MIRLALIGSITLLFATSIRAEDAKYRDTVPSVVKRYQTGLPVSISCSANFRAMAWFSAEYRKKGGDFSADYVVNFHTSYLNSLDRTLRVALFLGRNRQEVMQEIEAGFQRRTVGLFEDPRAGAKRVEEMAAESSACHKFYKSWPP